MRVEVNAVPNSREFRIERRNGRFVVRVKERAERGRANAELVRKMSELLGCEVRIVRGAGSRKKLLDQFAA
ncbi:MAG: DUF167 domain-containing protein [Candidatus Micrarchaeota archaeon]